MILSAKSIEAVKPVEPFEPRGLAYGMSYGLSYAGYDVRIDLPDGPLVVEPGGFSLASTLERFTMPDDILAFVHDKSTLARMGIALQNTVIEPAWCGHLTLEITNHGPAVFTFRHGMPIAQIIFHRVDAPCGKYEGKYNNAQRGAQAAVWEIDNG